MGRFWADIRVGAWIHVLKLQHNSESKRKRELSMEINDLIARVRPDIAQVMEEVAQPRKDTSFVDAIRGRVDASMRSQLAALHDKDPNVELMETSDSFGQVPVAVFHPEARPERAPCLIWFHGGGLIAGTYLLDYFFARHIADAVGCAVVGVEYRLAPENPFPCGVEDGYNALKWLSQPDGPAGFVATKIAVGGVSGGGPFATGTALKANKGSGPMVSFQLLQTPMLDHRSMSESINFSMDTRTWTRDLNRAAWDLYLANLREKGDPIPGEASPAAEQDYSKFPPTYLSVGDVDSFRDETIEFARGLVRAGVPVELHMFPQCPHGGDTIVPEGNELKVRARNEYAQVLRNAFAG